MEKMINNGLDNTKPVAIPTLTAYDHSGVLFRQVFGVLLCFRDIGLTPLGPFFYKLANYQCYRISITSPHLSQLRW